MYFKIHRTIKIIALDGKRRDNLSDMTAIVTNPNGIDASTIALSSAGNGYYYATFSPTLCGRWLVRIICNSYPKNNDLREYFVAQETVSNLNGEEFTYVGKTLASAMGKNKIHCNLWNISSSTIKIQKITANPKMDAIGTGQLVSFEGIRTSTQGTGIFVNIAGLDSQAPGLPGISFINGFTTEPIILSNGELFGFNSDSEESRSGSGYIDVFKSGFGVSPIIIRPNEGLCIKQGALGGAGKLNVFFYFTID